MINLSSKNFTKKETVFFFVDYSTDLDNFVRNIELAIQNLKEEEKQFIRNEHEKILHKIKVINSSKYKKSGKSESRP